MSKGRKVSRMDIPEYLIAGGICGFTSAFVDTPLDVVRLNLLLFLIVFKSLNQNYNFKLCKKS